MTKTSELVMMSPSELELPLVCAWKGCRASYKGDMPSGWVHLISYWSKTPQPFFCDIPPQDVQRDTQLCPEHARSLDELLIDLGYALLRGKAQGRA